MYSVDSEAEAATLLCMACPTNINGEYVARELAEDQTLENLALFSDHIHEMHEILVKKGKCKCKPRQDTAI